MKRFLALWMCLAALGSLRGAESRAELLFEINAALKGRDRGYFERCFRFDEADPVARGQAKAIIDEILRWRAPHVSATDRATADAPAPKLNGEWDFQVHIHDGPPPSSGFVFPAGRAGDAVKILLVSGK